MEWENRLNDFFQNQCQSWPLAQENYKKLDQVQVHTFTYQNICFYAQFNPARIASTAATVVDGKVERPCFLCPKSRPKEQMSLDCLTYKVLVNPVPLFPKHLTIVEKDHVSQCLNGRVADLLTMCHKMPHWVLFYNGAKCGASAPDHMHFQATERGVIPIERDLFAHLSRAVCWVKKEQFEISCLINNPLTLLLRSKNADIMEDELNKLINRLAEINGNTKEEAPLNLLAFYDQNLVYNIILFPLGSHRPQCYYMQDDDQFLISPGAIDMAGLLIVPREIDFQRLSTQKIVEIYDQVTWTKEKIEQLHKKIKDSEKKTLNGYYEK